MPKITGIGFGKTILFGEHFVVYGLPGLAAALSDKTIATVEKSEKFEFIDNRPETSGYKETKKDEIQRQLNALMDYFGLNKNSKNKNSKIQNSKIKITLSGNLECASGIGASAALAASIARALNEFLKLNLTDEKINEATFLAEQAGSGTPSGIDNTCAVFGGFISFEKDLKGGKNKIEKLKVKKPVEIVLANSGITQETKKIVAEVKEFREKNPKEFKEIEKKYLEIYKNALKALKEEKWQNLGRLMNENHALLQRITVSCPKLDEMQSIALTAGAFGAKLTGTGRGGLLIALTPGKELQEKVAKAFEEKGISVQETTTGVKA